MKPLYVCTECGAQGGQEGTTCPCGKYDWNETMKTVPGSLQPHRPNMPGERITPSVGIPQYAPKGVAISEVLYDSNTKQFVCSKKKHKCKHDKDDDDIIDLPDLPQMADEFSSEEFKQAIDPEEIRKKKRLFDDNIDGNDVEMTADDLAIDG